MRLLSKNKILLSVLVFLLFQFLIISAHATSIYRPIRKISVDLDGKSMVPCTWYEVGWKEIEIAVYFNDAPIRYCDHLILNIPLGLDLKDSGINETEEFRVALSASSSGGMFIPGDAYEIDLTLNPSTSSSKDIDNFKVTGSGTGPLWSQWIHQDIGSGIYTINSIKADIHCISQHGASLDDFHIKITDTDEAHIVPEPSTCLLFLLGLLGMVGVKKKIG